MQQATAEKREAFYRIAVETPTGMRTHVVPANDQITAASGAAWCP